MEHTYRLCDILQGNAGLDAIHDMRPPMSTPIRRRSPVMAAPLPGQRAARGRRVALQAWWMLAGSNIAGLTPLPLPCPSPSSAPESQ